MPCSVPASSRRARKSRRSKPSAPRYAIESMASPSAAARPPCTSHWPRWASKTGTAWAIPSYACAALTTAIRLQRGCPVLCDAGADHNLDPAGVPTDVRAAILVHLFGATARRPETDAPLVEDIAQSIGGDCGDVGAITVASFYATKLITTGEGGMLLTDDETLADFARDRRDYDNRDTDAQRYAYKMTDFQAAMGRVQLRRLPCFLDRREELADRYRQGLRDLPVNLPNPDGHVFFRYVLGTPKRNALEAYLTRRGIEAKRPVYKPAHHYLGGDFPNAERVHAECLSLPIYPSLVDADADLVIESVRRFFDHED